MSFDRQVRARGYKHMHVDSDIAQVTEKFVDSVELGLRAGKVGLGNVQRKTKWRAEVRSRAMTPC
jgi:hypothetical protein